MSLYIIEDDDGNVLTNECYFDNTMVYARLYYEPSEPEHDVVGFGGHIVTLTEEHEKVVVSEEEAEMLETAKHNPTLRPSFMITEYSNSHKGYILGNDLEDRLMCAYVNGYTVERPKRYVLPMEDTEYHNAKMRGNAQYYAVKGTGNWRPDAIALGTGDAVKRGYTVTQSDIDTAPAWVKAIKPVEVTDSEI